VSTAVSVKNKLGKPFLLVFFLPLFSVLSLFGCSGPSDERIREDFKQIFAKEVGASAQPIIMSVKPGEGDSDNVYQHVKFDLLAGENIAFKNGWLAGIRLNKGQKLYGGEVVALYQKKKEGWLAISYQLSRKPSQHP